MIKMNKTFQITPETETKLINIDTAVKGTYRYQAVSLKYYSHHIWLLYEHSNYSITTYFVLLLIFLQIICQNIEEQLLVNWLCGKYKNLKRL